MRTLLPILAVSLLPAQLRAQTLASYDAGSAGNPATAPDPETQGWDLDDPSAGQVTLSDLSPDGMTGENAWRIDDQVAVNNGRAHYRALFTPDELTDAFDRGWELSTTMRLEATSGLDIFIDFATGQTGSDSRYLLFFTVTGSDVTASDLAGNSFLCAGAQDGAYHSFAITKPAGAVDAEFLFDGVSLGQYNASSSAGTAPAGGVHWGSGSSVATATANFHAVEFRLLGFGTNFCTSAPNSTGFASVIETLGSPSVAANDFGLRAGPMVAGEPGLFYYGPDEISVPFGNGTRCVSGGPGQVVRIFPFAQADAAGFMSTTVDNSNPVHAGQLGAVGTTWKFQAWFRDSAGGGMGFDLSDGISVTFDA